MTDKDRTRLVGLREIGGFLGYRSLSGFRSAVARYSATPHPIPIKWLSTKKVVATVADLRAWEESQR